MGDFILNIYQATFWYFVRNANENVTPLMREGIEYYLWRINKIYIMLLLGPTETAQSIVQAF